MGGFRAPVLAAAAALALAGAASPTSLQDAAASSADDGAGFATLGRFVAYERPQVPEGNVARDNLGPIDLAALFYPGGLGGGDNLPCTPDRLDVRTNEIMLSTDPATGLVTGSGTLELSCRFHVGEGCEAEQRTVLVDFRSGELAADGTAITGEAEFRSLESTTQIWGTPGGLTGHLQPPSCTFGTTTLDPIGPYTLQWRLDLTTDPAVGYLASDVVAGDPAQRVGVFETSTTPSGGASAVDDPAGTAADEDDDGDEVEAEDAGTRDGAASDGDDDAIASGETTGGVDGRSDRDDATASADAEQGPAAAAEDGGTSGGGMPATTIVLLALVVISVLGWLGWAIVHRFIRRPSSYEQMANPFTYLAGDVTGAADGLAGAVTEGDGGTPSGDAPPATPGRGSTPPPAPETGDLGADVAAGFTLGLATDELRYTAPGSWAGPTLPPGREWVAAPTPAGLEPVEQGADAPYVVPDTIYQGHRRADGGWDVYDRTGSRLIGSTTKPDALRPVEPRSP